MLGKPVLHESSAKSQDLRQKDGVRVHVRSEAVQHLEHGGVEVNQRGARLHQERGGWGRGGATDTFGCPRSIAALQILSGGLYLETNAFSPEKLAEWHSIRNFFNQTKIGTIKVVLLTCDRVVLWNYWRVHRALWQYRDTRWSGMVEEAWWGRRPLPNHPTPTGRGIVQASDSPSMTTQILYTPKEA